jgi:hypothetical protein
MDEAEELRQLDEYESRLQDEHHAQQALDFALGVWGPTEVLRRVAVALEQGCPVNLVAPRAAGEEPF